MATEWNCRFCNTCSIVLSGTGGSTTLAASYWEELAVLQHSQHLTEWNWRFYNTCSIVLRGTGGSATLAASYWVELAVLQHLQHRTERKWRFCNTCSIVLRGNGGSATLAASYWVQLAVLQNLQHLTPDMIDVMCQKPMNIDNRYAPLQGRRTLHLQMHNSDKHAGGPCWSSSSGTERNTNYSTYSDISVVLWGRVLFMLLKWQ
jgi:hypothetical protein